LFRVKLFAAALLACSTALSYTRLVVLEGHEATGRFGEAVCGLDFNHDGLADVFVGEPGWNKVYCYFGSAPFDTIPDLVFKGTAGTKFGNCLTSIGDVNSDGIQDIAIGAPRDNAGGANAGRVYVYFGSTNPDATPDIILTGHERSGRFGTSISGGCDVNQDSGIDILVGASGEQHAYLFLGGTALDTIPDLTLHDGNGDYFGGAVALLGDVNRDTFADMLVGDYRHSGGGLHFGGCFLYLGSNPPDPGLDTLWNGEENYRQIGVTVAGPGDLNGDGFDDLCFGASYTSKVGIYFGAASISPEPDLLLSGQRFFGSWIAGSQDINGDCYSDLVIGADGDDCGNPSGPGYASLFLGGNPMSTTPDTVLAGENEGDMFGSCVCFCGDINNDRRIEFCIGAPGHDTQGPNAGRAYIFTSSYTGIENRPAKNPHLYLLSCTIVRQDRMPHIKYQIPSGHKARLILIDASGRTVLTRKIRSQSGTIILTELATGVYNLVLQTGNTTTRTKFVLVK